MVTNTGKALIDPEVVIKKIGLVEGLRVANLGCGRTGQFIFSLSKALGETGVVYAVDIIKDILQSIKSRAESEGYNNVHTVWSDIEKYGFTPIPAGSLDVCFFVNVMFLLKDRVGALKEATRLLNDSGIIVVVDWARRLGTLGPSDEQLLTREDMMDLAATLNLRLVDNFSAGDYHYGLVFTK